MEGIALGTLLYWAIINDWLILDTGCHSTYACLCMYEIANLHYFYLFCFCLAFYLLDALRISHSAIIAFTQTLCRLYYDSRISRLTNLMAYFTCPPTKRLCYFMALPSGTL